MIRFKNILYFLILMVLFFPVIQNSTSLVKLKLLKGSYTLENKPVFSVNQYLTGEYQDLYNTYLEQHIGLRPFFVRLNNQLAFSLFRIAQASYVEIGKNNYLFEEYYIFAYLGRDFRGKEVWDEKVEKLKFISEKLKEKNTDIIVFLAPGKATFFPEYIPEKYDPDRKELSNYTYLLEKIINNDIYCIDFNRYFIQMKDTSSYALYPKTGIHWSSYGETLALDSLIGYMESLKQIRMVDFGYSEVEVTKDLQTPDNDIAEGMNLLFDISYYAMPYPKLYFHEDSATYKPVVITITDSYYWNLHGRGITQRIYGEDNFWYYFKSAHGDKYIEGQMVQDLNVKEEIESADFIVLLATEGTLNKFPYGFVEEVYDLYTQESEDQYVIDEKKIRFIEQVIRNDSGWFEEIRRKAVKWNISIEEMLRRDAEWLYKKKLENESNK